MIGRDGSGTQPTELQSILRANRDAEREGARSRDEARLLQSLLASIATIAAGGQIDEIVSTLLRTIRAPLGFQRAMVFDVEETGVVVARRLIDASETIEIIDDVVNYEDSPAIADTIAKPGAIACGYATDLATPIVDVRAWYALAPIVERDRTTGLVYADGHRLPVVSEWHMQLLQSVVTIASAAIQNATLLEETQLLANRDPLTGLYNRRAFNERLSRFLARGASGPAFVFAIIDVDDFKSINDRRGHAVGDAVLKRLARALLSSSRTEDVVGRLAGDEFVVVLCGGVTASDADAMVARLSAHVRGAGISCSIGAARFPADALDGESLFAAADRSLYRAKAAGKNRHAITGTA